MRHLQLYRTFTQLSIGLATAKSEGPAKSEVDAEEIKSIAPQ